MKMFALLYIHCTRQLRKFELRIDKVRNKKGNVKVRNKKGRKCKLRKIVSNCCTYVCVLHLAFQFHVRFFFL
jgi:hypothetical protein